jgi:hypothetical protein
MSMKPEQENFHQLRRLLKLKRYEQPPPGYFNDLARQIVARIEAGDSSEELVDRPFWETPWMRWLLGLFDHRPALAGAFGMAVCALLVAGIVHSERMKTPPLLPWLPSDSGTPIASAEPLSPLASAQTIGLDNQSGASMLFFSTNPIGATQPSGSLFEQIRLNAQPVNFIPRGN